MSDNRLRVGFIGCGRHATKMLYPSLHLAGLELTAVCDLDESKAQRNARWFGAQRYYTDHRQLLAAEAIDAVLICTSPGTHAYLVSECLDKGLPVFVEKPLAMNLADVESIQAHSRVAGVPVMVGTMKRHALIYRRVKEIIERPDFGLPSAVQAKMTIGWKNGNGYALLLDMGVHMLDLLLALMGNVDEVTYQKAQFEETHISYAILLHFASGAVGTLFLSDQHSWIRTNERVEITGNGQFVVAENLTRLEHYLPDGEIHTWEPGFSIPNDENLTHFLVGYAGELQAFADAIRTGSPPHADIADACKVFQLIKDIEPLESYGKSPQTFDHWQSENTWLK